MKSQFVQSLARGISVVVIVFSTSTASAATKQTLHSFTAFPNGAYPSSLVEDSAGNFYGTAEGGAYGVVFKLARGKSGTWTENVIHDFAGGTTDATYPIGALILDLAGNLYGVAQGGTYNLGAVFKLSPTKSGWSETLLHSFAPGYGDGSFPQAGLAIDAAGNLYGATSEGGNSNCYTSGGGWIGCGTVFEISPQSNSTWKESILYNFQELSDGGFPTSALVLDKAGNLYGTTQYGGGGNCYYGGCGVVFELSKGSSGVWSETVLYSFSSLNAPTGGVVFDTHGNLYAFQYSYFLQFTPSTSGTWTQNILYTFSSVGPGANAIPVFDAAGSVYGVTNTYGTDGSIFKLSPGSGGTWTESTLYNFTGGADGADPRSLILDSTGNLYVPASAGGLSCATYSSAKCGTILELSPNGSAWIGSTLHEFAPGPVDGAFPLAGLVSDNAGTFYGTTDAGGASNFGTVYKISASSNGTWRTSLLHSFTGYRNGANPTSSLILDGTGNLYGTVSSGGPYGGGFVFKLSPSAKGGWTETVLYNFVGTQGSTDGFGPNAGLTFDSQGNLYGSTPMGGLYGCGSVFKLTPSSGNVWTEMQLYSFPSGCYSGVGSTSPVIFDDQGNLYGTNATGGNFNWGIVYKLTPPSGSGTQWSESTIHSFDFYDGGLPNGVVFDAAGNVYTPTEEGGAYSGGEIAKFTNSTGTWTMDVIHNFSGANGDGARPAGGLVSDAAGDLYGTTICGVASACYTCGTVFKLSPSNAGWKETILYGFDGGLNGGTPYGSLVVDSQGNLYGTTSAGGSGNMGTVFEIKP
jgi:uncharacterized repeat protein (TIGR03803 family)